MRRVNGDSRSVVNNTYHTITAAADAIAAVDHRYHRSSSVQKRRWGSCLSIHWCFGSLKQSKRFGHAVLVPEPSPETEVPLNSTLQSPEIVFPFAAPPSSPASFFQSEPPSALQSPTANTILSFTSHHANMYSVSPDGPSSIFAIGPFAHETQPVSPPVNFSTFTTEPSTAPFTPPESIQLTTPSSPEVPFAQFLLQPNLQKGESDQQYSFPGDEFQSYQFYPGSPISHLISPRSVISRSGTSSPLPDCDFAASASLFSNFPVDCPPKLLNLGKHSTHDAQSHRRSDSFSQSDVGFKSSTDFDLNPLTSESILDQSASNECRSRNVQIPIDGSQGDEPAAVANHIFSFELSDEDALRRVENEQLESNILAATYPIEEPFVKEKEKSTACSNTTNAAEEKAHVDDDEETQHHQKQLSVTLGSVKEFNFDNSNGTDSPKPKINSGWWAMRKL